MYARIVPCIKTVSAFWYSANRHTIDISQMRQLSLVRQVNVYGAGIYCQTLLKNSKYQGDEDRQRKFRWQTTCTFYISKGIQKNNDIIYDVLMI